MKKNNQILLGILMKIDLKIIMHYFTDVSCINNNMIQIPVQSYPHVDLFFQICGKLVLKALWHKQKLLIM